MTQKPINQSILETIREILERISSKDHSTTNPDTSLHLDSIIRLSMIVEIENHFEIEIETSEIEPEIFDSLDSLSSFVDSFHKD